MLHLLGVLSGGNEPPLCKGRWLAQARRRDWPNLFVRLQTNELVEFVGVACDATIPQPPSASAPFTQGSLWFVRPECPSIFLTSTAFVSTKAKPRARRGESRIITVIWTTIHSIGDLLGSRVSQSHIRKHSTKANLPQGSCEMFQLASQHLNRFYTFHTELI